MERALRQEKRQKMVMVFDLLDSGFQNIDMEFIHAMLNILKSYYPETLRWILIFEMPWVMNGMRHKARQKKALKLTTLTFHYISSHFSSHQKAFE
jgi:hypothetical protein